MRKAVLPHLQIVFHKTDLVALPVAFIQILDEFAGHCVAFKAMRQFSACDAFPDPAAAAM